MVFLFKIYPIDICFIKMEKRGLNWFFNTKPSSGTMKSSIVYCVNLFVKTRKN